MSEEDNTEPIKPEPEEESEEQEKASSDLINKANEAADRLEKANIQLSKNIARQEAIKVEQTLGGTATAGTPQVSEEDKVLSEAKKLIEGSGFEELLDPPKP